MSGLLADEAAARRRESDKARRIQENLLPDAADPPGWRVTPVFRPADAVGGDFYDLAVAPGGRLVACVADVTGHGVPAALGAAMLKVLFAAAIRECDDPGHILASVNRGFTAISRDEQFASMAVATLDPGVGRLRWAGAGHEPCYRLRPGEAPLTLGTTGPWIGMDPAIEWETVEADLLPGDRLALLTDGWAEAGGEGGDMLGRDRLRRWIDDSADGDPEAAARLLLDGLTAWRGPAGGRRDAADPRARSRAGRDAVDHQVPVEDRAVAEVVATK